MRCGQILQDIECKWYVNMGSQNQVSTNSMTQSRWFQHQRNVNNLTPRQYKIRISYNSKFRLSLEDVAAGKKFLSKGKIEVAVSLTSSSQSRSYAYSASKWHQKNDVENLLIFYRFWKPIQHGFIHVELLPLFLS